MHHKDGRCEPPARCVLDYCVAYLYLDSVESFLSSAGRFCIGSLCCCGCGSSVYFSPEQVAALGSASSRCGAAPPLLPPCPPRRAWSRAGSQRQRCGSSCIGPLIWSQPHPAGLATASSPPPTRSSSARSCHTFHAEGLVLSHRRQVSRTRGAGWRLGLGCSTQHSVWTAVCTRMVGRRCALHVLPCLSRQRECAVP